MGKMRQFRRAIRGCVGKTLAYHIRDGYGAALAGFLEQVGRGQKISDKQIMDMMCSDDESREQRKYISEFLSKPRIAAPAQKGQKATAVVSARGVAMYDVEYQPVAFSTMNLAIQINNLATNPDVGTILIEFDTPGGMVTGTMEAADAIWDARKKKTVVALVNPLCASAGYWLASQCETIVAVPSADVGSIGVFTSHTDCSKAMADAGIVTTFIFAGDNKVEGNMFEPLTDSAKNYIQSEVDTIYGKFVGYVARGRGISVDDVNNKFGQGRCLMAQAAKKVGMIDAIMTIDQAMAQFGVTEIAVQARRRAEASTEAADQSAETAEALEVRKFDIAEIASESTAPSVTVSESASVEFVGTLGCEQITFTEGKDEYGPVISVTSEWPQKAAFAPDAFEGSRFAVVESDAVKIKVSNGAAIYDKAGQTIDGAWVCELREGSAIFNKPPASVNVGAEQAAAPPVVDEAAARAMRVAARARRLAILRG